MPPKKAIKKVPAKAEPSAVSSLDSINDMFRSLKKINEKIASVHGLYAEADAIKRALLPLFIKKNEDGSFTVLREIIIGSEKHRFSPSFYDVDKAMVKTKSWKSTPFETGTIE